MRFLCCCPKKDIENLVSMSKAPTKTEGTVQAIARFNTGSFVAGSADGQLPDVSVASVSALASSVLGTEQNTTPAPISSSHVVSVDVDPSSSGEESVDVIVPPSPPVASVTSDFSQPSVSVCQVAVTVDDRADGASAEGADAPSSMPSVTIDQAILLPNQEEIPFDPFAEDDASAAGASVGSSSSGTMSIVGSLQPAVIAQLKEVQKRRWEQKVQVLIDTHWENALSFVFLDDEGKDQFRTHMYNEGYSTNDSSKDTHWHRTVKVPTCDAKQIRIDLVECRIGGVIHKGNRTFTLVQGMLPLREGASIPPVTLAFSDFQ